MPTIVTIDGPSASGKSTISKLLTEKLGYLCFNTGSLYRIIALKCSNLNVNIKNELAVEKVLEQTNITVDYLKGSARVLLDGCDVSNLIRTEKISYDSSIVSQYPAVRFFVKKIQRATGEKHNLVIEGRDIGTEIFPDAKYKFYLDASVEVRAKRRFDELISRGETAKWEDVLQDTLDRDERDINRPIAPLRKPEGAIIIDASNKTILQVYKEMLKNIK